MTINLRENSQNNNDIARASEFNVHKSDTLSLAVNAISRANTSYRFCVRTRQRTHRRTGVTALTSVEPVPLRHIHPYQTHLSHSMKYDLPTIEIRIACHSIILFVIIFA